MEDTWERRAWFWFCEKILFCIFNFNFDFDFDFDWSSRFSLEATWYSYQFFQWKTILMLLSLVISFLFSLRHFFINRFHFHGSTRVSTWYSPPGLMYVMRKSNNYRLRWKTRHYGALHERNCRWTSKCKLPIIKKLKLVQMCVDGIALILVYHTPL